MTQEQFSEACSLSASYIGHIERGTRKLSVETLYRICETLRVGADYLLLDSAEPEGRELQLLDALTSRASPSQRRIFFNVAKAVAEKIEEL
jgi:transcriptional regulator with XRE-family HTH domain